MDRRSARWTTNTDSWALGYCAAIAYKHTAEKGGARSYCTTFVRAHSSLHWPHSSGAAKTRTGPFLVSCLSADLNCAPDKNDDASIAEPPPASATTIRKESLMISMAITNKSIESSIHIYYLITKSIINKQGLPEIRGKRERISRIETLRCSN